MSEDFTPEQISDLKKQLEDTKKQLEDARNSQIVVQHNPQDQFIETLFDKGGQMFMEYMKVSTETQRYHADKDAEVEKEELKVIDSLDTKEKKYKGILIITCILALVLSALFIPKPELIIPVISLIIGLLFKSNSLSDFFSHSKSKYKAEN